MTDKVADLSPEAQAEWRRRQNAQVVRRQYREAGKLDEWEKKREASKPLDPDALPFSDTKKGK